MKKNIFLILIVLCLICCGCDDKKNVDEVNATNTSSNEISSNSNKVSNSNSNVKKGNDKIGKNKVTLYLFYSSTCPHCHAEIEWLDSIKDKYDYLNIVKYEARENTSLYESVVDKLNVNSYSVPLTIIGSDFTVGYSEAKNSTLLNLIESYSTYDHCDAVDTIKNNGNLEKCIKSNKK